MWKRGDKVQLDSRVEGTVLEVKGEFLVVLLPSVGQVRIPASRAQPVGTPGTPTVTTSKKGSSRRSSRGSPPAKEDAMVLQAVEALRFGLVPHHSLETLTLGFDDLEGWIIETLPRRSGRIKIAEVCGNYGTGKSHTMAVVRHVAVREQYVTASVEVDGKSISLSQPDRLLGSLWQSMTANDLDGTHPVLDLHLAAIKNGLGRGPESWPGLSRIKNNLEFIRKHRRDESLTACEEGVESMLASTREYTSTEVMTAICGSEWRFYEETLQPLIGRQVDGRPRDFADSLVGYALIAQAAGYKGLVVTIDELEVEHNLEKRLLERIGSLMEYLYDCAEGRLRYPQSRLALFFASAGTEGHQGDSLIENIMKVSGGKYYALKRWNASHRTKLARRIHALYARAYGTPTKYDAATAQEVEASISDDPGEDRIRTFIKRYVSQLDCAHGPP